MTWRWLLTTSLINLVMPWPLLAQPQLLAQSNADWQRAEWFRQTPQFNRDSTAFYHNRAIALLERSRPTAAADRPNQRLAEAYSQLSDYYYRNYNNAAAAQAALKAQHYVDQLAKGGVIDKRLQYAVLINQAFAEVDDGDPRRSLALLLKAQSLLADDQTPDVEAMVLNDKSRFYNRYRNGVSLEAASLLRMLQRSRQLYESDRTGTPNHNDRALADVYKELTWHYNVEAQADSCDYYFDKLYALLPRLKDPVLASWYYALRGNNLSRRGQYAAAQVLIEKGLDVMKTYRLTDTHIYPFSLNLLGVIAQKGARYKEAIALFTEARELYIKTGFATDNLTFYEHMTDLYEQQGNYQKALSFYRKVSEATQQREEARSEKSLRESELQVDLVRQEKKLTQQQAEQSGYIKAILITALATVLLTIILVGLYRNVRTKQRVNRQLETLNADLATKNALLDKRNAENELLLKEIHHRVKNNLQVVSSLLALQAAKIDDPDMQEVMQTSQNRVQSMGILHQKLYQSEHLAFVEMRQYFMDLGENILDSYNETNRITVECPMPTIELDVDTAVPVGLIVNELLTNALKYAFPTGQPGRVRVSLETVEADVLQLQVADDGVGKTMGAQPHGTGFGTQLVDLLIQQLGGSIRQDLSHGTLISISFPALKRLASGSVVPVGTSN